MPTISVTAVFGFGDATFNAATGGTTAGHQSRPEVVGVGGLNYMISWLTAAPGGANQVEYGVFSASNTTLLSGTIRQVASGTVNAGAPAAALLDNGQAVLVWQQFLGGAPAEYMARINNNGTLAQGPTLISSGGLYNGTPQVTAVTGGFITGYGSNNLEDENEGAYLNGRTNTGAASGFGLQSVATGTLNRISDVAVARLANGTIASVWRDEATSALSMRVYNADGTVAMNGGNPIERLNFDSLGTNGAPRIVALADGKFVVAYSDTGWGGIGTEISLAMFSATGANAAPSGLFIRATNNSVADADPDIVAHNTGHFTVVFTQTNVTTGDDIYMRTYDIAGNAIDSGAATALIATTANERRASIAAVNNGSIMLAFEKATGANGDAADTAIVGGRYDLYRNIVGDGTHETLAGNDFREIISGLGGDDVLQGGAGNDRLQGGDGNDTLYGNAGMDEYFGGIGDDVLIADGGADFLFENEGEGIDTAWLVVNGAAISGEIEFIRLVGTATSYAVDDFTRAWQAVANPNLSSTLGGSAFNDVLWGGAMADFLSGANGDDTLRGGGGADIMVGGIGNDHFVINHSGVSISGDSLDGIDTAWVAVNGWTSSAFVEIVRLAAPGANSVTGSGGNDILVANQGEASTLNGAASNDELWGSTFADSLVGGTGDDIIRGQGGADTMRGGADNDSYVVLNQNAVIIENPGEGYDTLWIDIAAGLMFTMAPETERANLAGTANSVTGNASDNVIVGNPTTTNDLRGGAGADTIFGSTFLDLFWPGAGNDVIYSLGGNDRIIIDAPGSGYDQVAGFVQGSAKIWFQPASGVTSMGGITLNSANGNTQVEWNGNAILVFGVASMSASDFLFT